MPCEVIGASTASGKHAGYGRGALYHAIDTPADWGLSTTDNQTFICTISDATAAEVRPFISASSNESDTFEGPRWLMTPPEVGQADGKTYTFIEFQSFLVDQS